MAAVRRALALIGSAPTAASRRICRKAEGHFVTALDRRCERAMRALLQSALPTAGFLGEETGSHHLERDLLWVVDPIDGTSNFSRGLSPWAIAVALLAAGSPVVAAIWSEPDRALYTAVAGRGAHAGRRRLGRRPARWDDGALVGCQWRLRPAELAFLCSLQRAGARVRTLGSTVCQLLAVATGRLDANVQQQGHLWDFAAPALVLAETGCLFTDWRGRPVFPLATVDGGHTATIAARPPVHCEVLRCIGSSSPP